MHTSGSGAHVHIQAKVMIYTSLSLIYIVYTSEAEVLT